MEGGRERGERSTHTHCHGTDTVLLSHLMQGLSEWREGGRGEKVPHTTVWAEKRAGGTSCGSVLLSNLVQGLACR